MTGKPDPERGRKHAVTAESGEAPGEFPSPGSPTQAKKSRSPRFGVAAPPLGVSVLFPCPATDAPACQAAPRGDGAPMGDDIYHGRLRASANTV